MPERERDRDSGDPEARAAEGWRWASAKAALLVGAAVLGLAYAPDWLVEVLSTRTSPRVRDALVTAWVAAFFVVLCWGMVRLQRKRQAGR